MNQQNQPANPDDANQGRNSLAGANQPAKLDGGAAAAPVSPGQATPAHLPATSQPAAGWGAPMSSTEGWGAPSSGTQGWGTSNTAALKTGAGNRWGTKRTLMVAGIAVVVAAGTAGGFYAMGSASSASAANTAPGQGGAGGFGAQQGQNLPGGGAGQGGTGQMGPGQMGGMAPDGFGMAGGLNAAIHSEYVVLRNEEYVTMADQLGTVSDVSSTSLTVKSEDGFTRTYALNNDTTVAQGVRQRGGNTGTLTLADVKAGATIRVTATKAGDSYTATSIRLTTTTSSQGSSSSQGSGTSS